MKQIFIVGPARSGTTIFGDTMSKVIDCEYWLEPKYLWKYKNFNLKSDVLCSSDVTPDIAKYIKKRIALKLKRKNKTVYLDKTPSNVFRLPFIRAIFPDCYIVFLERDPINTILSAEKKWKARIPKSVFWRRLRNLDITIIQLIKLLFFVIKNRNKLWGPVNHEIVKAAEISTLKAAVIQYKESITYMNAYLKETNERIVRVSYEDFTDNPEKTVARVLNCIDEPADSERLKMACHDVKLNQKSYTETDKFKLEIIKDYLNDV